MVALNGKMVFLLEKIIFMTIVKLFLISIRIFHLLKEQKLRKKNLL